MVIYVINTKYAYKDKNTIIKRYPYIFFLPVTSDDLAPNVTELASWLWWSSICDMCLCSWSVYKSASRIYSKQCNSSILEPTDKYNFVLY